MINIKERKLIYWLDQNSRTTNKQLGKKIGLSEQAVAYNLSKFEREGLIKRYITFVNTLSLGYEHYKILIRLYDTNTKKEIEILEYLTKKENIRWVVSCLGKWDLSFSVMAKNANKFLEIFREIEEKYGKYMLEKNISILVKSPGFSKRYLINEKSTKTLDYNPKTNSVKLDDIDKKILKNISQNARKSLIDISKDTRLSLDIVRYRIKKMEQNKLISGYTIQLDLKKIGLLRYSVFFNLHGINKEIEENMIIFAKRYQNIIFVLVLIGNYDLSLELEVESQEELRNILKDFREEFSENIRDFEIIQNTEEYKYDFYPF